MVLLLWVFSTVTRTSPELPVQRLWRSYAANDIIGVATWIHSELYFSKTALQNNGDPSVITNSRLPWLPGCKPLHWNNSSSGGNSAQLSKTPSSHASATYHTAQPGLLPLRAADRLQSTLPAQHA